MGDERLSGDARERLCVLRTELSCFGAAYWASDVRPLATFFSPFSMYEADCEQAVVPRHV